jgi:S-adenosylmethionine:tRNA ribosyltransferase-isomerase
VLENGELGRVRIRIESELPWLEVLERIGQTPLPPYIQRKDATPERRAVDKVRYQTVFAREPGAVAAPTAGLHFTPEVLGRLAAQGWTGRPSRCTWASALSGPWPWTTSKRTRWISSAGGFR